MTREEFEYVEPGMKLLIGDRFVKDPYEGLEVYFNTVQTVERFDLDDTGWVYFEGIKQPFAISEIVGIYYEHVIDDESVPYESGDMCLIFGEV